MTTARFYFPATSLGETLISAFDSAEVLSYSASEIRVGLPGGPTLLLLSGQFSFTANGELTGGTLTGVTTYRADGITKELMLSGMNVDLLTLVDVALNGSENDVLNLFFGGADRFTGSSGADELPTFNGNDTIDGGSGKDTMEGGKGSDLYYVRDVGDLVVETNSSSASGGIDTVQSYLAGYTLPNNVEVGRIMTSTAAKLVGNGLANSLTGGSGANTLVGGAGNDTLSGGNGNDVLDGGSGNDRYVVQASGDKVIEQAGGGTDTIDVTISYTLPSEVEHLLLSGTNNSTLTGNGLANRITGNGGNNVLDGGTGIDTMTGGAGNDTFRVNSSGDRVVEGAGGGSDTIKTTVSYTLPSEVEHLLLSGTNNSTLTGNGLANRITGNGGNNVLDGGAGIDTMTGGAGNDTFSVNSSGDRVVEGAGGGSDTIKTTVSYMLPSEVEHLLLSGTNNSTLTGNGLANRITGNGGNNVLDGGTGIDTMTGGAGNDTFSVNSSGDRVVESAGGGSDTIKTTVSYTLPSEVEHLLLSGTNNSTLTGNGLANRITGNDGNNVLSGDAGNDLLRGGAGNDVLYGGSGKDLFRFDTALSAATVKNVDQIKDFNPAQDTIQLENSIFESLGATKTGAIDPAHFRANTTGVAQDSNDYLIYETDTGKLYYDSNGSAAGESIQFTVLQANLALTSADYVLV